MCPNCRALVEEISQLKELVVAQQARLVYFDAKLEEGKILGEDTKAEPDGVASVATIYAQNKLTYQALQRAEYESAAVRARLVNHSLDYLKTKLLEEVAKHIRYESQHSAFTNTYDVTAYLRFVPKR